MKILVVFVVILALAAGGYWVFSSPSEVKLAEIEPIPLNPAPPKLESEMSKSLVARLISEDTDIKTALEGEAEKVVSSGEDPNADLYAPKTNDEILFDMMAPWFYMGFRNIINNEQQGQFKNTNTQRKSGWLSVGGTLEGAEIIHLDPEKAVVFFADATHEFLYVPEFPDRDFDPTVPRTPEQIKAAQRRYSQVYMPKFIKQGREYDRLRGQKSFTIPTKEEQVQSGQEYLEHARVFAENAATSQPPAEALIDPSQLTEEQRQAHQRYTEMFKRSSEDTMQAIEEQRQSLENELTQPEESDQPSGE